MYQAIYPRHACFLVLPRDPAACLRDGPYASNRFSALYCVYWGSARVAPWDGGEAGLGVIGGVLGVGYELQQKIAEGIVG